MTEINTKVKPNIKHARKLKYKLSVLLAEKPKAERSIILQKFKDASISEATISRIRTAVEGDTYEPLFCTMKTIASIMNIPIEKLNN
jgi:hypothetical protein